MTKGKIVARENSMLSDMDAGVWYAQLKYIGKKCGLPLDAIQPQMIVNEAKKKASPLHRFYNWNIAEAAAAHWLQQTRTYIGCVMVLYAGQSQPTRFMASIEMLKGRGNGTSRVYAPMSRIMEDAGLRKQLLAQAKDDFDGYRAKYENLKELAVLFSVADKVFQKANGKKLAAIAAD